MTYAGRQPARLLTQCLVTGTGTQLRAVLLYGSHLLGAAPDRYSAHDLVVVVEDYLGTYRELRRRGFTHRPPRLMASLAWLLPPSVIAFSPEGAEGPIAKCLIISARDFERELSARSRDHFMIARMIQEVGVLYVRDAAAERWLDEALEAARRTVLDWAAPYVATPFGAESLTREMIAICYRHEIRPESGSRASSVYEAQRAYLVETYEKLLADACIEGTVVREGHGYRSARQPGPMARLKRSAYFTYSTFRVTARWIKHMLTFENWLPYLVRKVERRTGMTVELTPLEARLPLIFLWPRLFLVLRNRPAEEAAEAEGAGEAEETEEAEGAEETEEAGEMEEAEETEEAADERTAPPTSDGDG